MADWLYRVAAGEDRQWRRRWAVLSGLVGLVGLAGVRLSLAFLAALLLGIVIEFAQLPVPGRLGGDWRDILANGLGAASAALGLYAFCRICLRRPPRGMPGR